MNLKKYSATIIWVVIGILLLIVAGFFLNLFVENKAETLLKKEKINFSDVSINVLGNNAILENAKWERQSLQLDVNKVEIEGLGYWKLLVGNEINIDKILISSPTIRIQSSKKEKATSKKNSGTLKQKIHIETIEVENGHFSKLDSLQEKQLYLPNFNMVLKEIEVDSASLQKKIPFSYKSFLFNGKRLTAQVDPRHNLSIGDLQLTENATTIEKLHLQSKYSKEKFQQHIKKEKDRYDLQIDTIKLSNYHYSFVNNSVFVESSRLGIENIDFQIYRDKGKPDDLSYKPMYSEMLRKLPIYVMIDTVSLQRCAITYQEKVKSDRQVSEVKFNDLQATILKLGNYSEKKTLPQTRISVSTLFMNTTPLEVNWTFNVANTSDWFAMNGNLRNLKGKEMNGFLKPSMNMTAQGDITRLDFNFKGNKTNAGGDVVLDFHDFKVEMLRKDGTKKSGFFSAIAIFFVKNDSKNTETSLEGIEIKRDKTKSFWNYLWTFIRKGTLKSFT